MIRLIPLVLFLLFIAAVMVMIVVGVAGRILGRGPARPRAESGRHEAMPYEPWYQRLNQLHFLLSQVLAADSSLTQLPRLPLQVSQSLQHYFGDSLQPPQVPPGRVVDRVILLEGWLMEIQAADAAGSSLSPLPPALSSKIDRYLQERNRRLEA